MKEDSTSKPAAKPARKSVAKARMSKIDKIEKFGRDEKWQVDRVSDEQVKFAWPSQAHTVTHVVTALEDGQLRIESTPDRPLPSHKRVKQNVLPDPSVTLSPDGVPTRSRTIRVSAVKLSESVIDEFCVEAMIAVDGLIQPN